ncbi:MAG TPA: hypothetical protein VN750_00920 [Steroidobacteraceae bacterium]|nr:hypothetical protein [Steroidobacteraceae bacterium]
MIPGTWQQVGIATLALLIILGAAICFRPKKRNRRVRAVRPHTVADYSEKRARALEQLGDDYLLAQPINRRHA